jgi:hypothetical protein
MNRTNLSLIVQSLHLTLLMSIFIPSFLAMGDDASTCAENISINRFFIVGPNERLCFLGKNIDTWDKWILYMFLFALTQGLSSASAELSNAWFANQLAEPQVVLNPYIAHLNVQFYYFNWALDNVLTVFTALTQVDFLFASMLGSSVITLSTTCYYFREKEKYRKKMDFINNDEF